MSDIKRGDIVEIQLTTTGVVNGMFGDVIIAYVEELGVDIHVPLSAVTKVVPPEPGDGSILVTCEGMVYQKFQGTDGDGWYRAGSVIKHTWDTFIRQGGYTVIREGWL